MNSKIIIVLAVILFAASPVLAAYDFDGSGDYLTFVKSAAATDLQQISYAWTSSDDVRSGYHEVFWMGGAWSSDYHSFVQHDNGGFFAFKANWTINEGQWYITDPDGAYHHYVITYDFGSTNPPRWYKDGAEVSVSTLLSPTGSADYLKDTSNLKIGAYSDGSAEYWDGKIGEFAIWNRVLSASEAAMVSKGFSPLFVQKGLVFYAPLVRGAYDRISGKVGVVTNAIVATHPKVYNPR